MMAGRYDTRKDNSQGVVPSGIPGPPPLPLQPARSSATLHGEWLSPTSCPSPLRQHRPDSGYNTASPATTSSPAPTSTPTPTCHQHFLFDDDASLSAAATPTTLGLRRSPDIFRASRETSPGPTHSESHMTQFHMDSDDEEEKKNEAAATHPRRAVNFVGFQLPNLSNESDETTNEEDEDDEDSVFYNRGHIMRQWGVSSEPPNPRYRSGSLSLRTRRYCTLDMDDDNDIVSTELGPFSATPNIGSRPPGEVRHTRGRSLRHDVFRGRAARSRSFSVFGHSHEHDTYLGEERSYRDDMACRSPGAVIWSEPRHITSTSPLSRPRSATAGQEISYRDNGVPQRLTSDTSDLGASAQNDVHSMFSFDADEISSYHRVSLPQSHRLRDRLDINPGRSFGFTQTHNTDNNDATPLPLSSIPDGLSTRRRASRPQVSAPVLIDRPPQSPSSIARRRRVGVVSLTTHLRLSCGNLLPTMGVVAPGEDQERSVSTQTPHATCSMIQQLMDTPAPLPSRARGTAADRLRHYSDGSPAWPSTPPPLPDIVPSTCPTARGWRDRSASAPDLRARLAGREAGRELRRLSDEFFNSPRFARSLSPVREDRGGHPASFPRTRTVTYFRHAARNFGAFLAETFNSWRRSSGDLHIDDDSDDL